MSAVDLRIKKIHEKKFFSLSVLILFSHLKVGATSSSNKQADIATLTIEDVCKQVSSKIKGKFAQGFHLLFIVDLPWAALWAVILEKST